MRRVTALGVVAMLALSGGPFSRVLYAAQAQAASLLGTATTSTGQTIANVTVQLRDLVTGSLAGTTTSGAAGSFTFAGLQAGTYSVEVVSAAGQVLSASASITVTAGATVTGVTVSATAAAVGAAAGAAGAGAAAAGAGAGAGAAAAGVAAAGAASAASAAVVTAVAAAAGVAGAVASTANPASSVR